MGIDAKTLMLMSLAIAVIASASLLAEARATRERAQQIWGLGFLAIVLGCAMTPLRDGVSFELGVWVANGLLVVAHILFLFGSARFVGRPLSRGVWAILLLWLPLVAWPADAGRTQVFSALNAGLVGGLALASAWMVLRHRPAGDWAASRLGAIFGVHGAFYTGKAVLAWVPGGFVDLVGLKGVILQASLVEGVPVELLLLLVMAAAARRRHEVQLRSWAESDPLTGLLNRRAFDEQAQAMLRRDGSALRAGALLLCDLNAFKIVNDTHGHAAGDAVLVAFADLLRNCLPTESLIARYGGDEFVALIPDVDAATLPQLGVRIEHGVRVGPSQIPTSATVGAARAIPGDALDALLRHADSATYAAKRGGRDNIVAPKADTSRPSATALELVGA